MVVSEAVLWVSLNNTHGGKKDRILCVVAVASSFLLWTGGPREHDSVVALQRSVALFYLPFPPPMPHLPLPHVPHAEIAVGVYTENRCDICVRCCSCWQRVSESVSE